MTVRRSRSWSLRSENVTTPRSRAQRRLTSRLFLARAVHLSPVMETTTTQVNRELGGFVSLAQDPTMLPSMPGLTSKRRAVGGWAAFAAVVVALVTRIGF